MRGFLSGPNGALLAAKPKQLQESLKRQISALENFFLIEIMRGSVSFLKGREASSPAGEKAGRSVLSPGVWFRRAALWCWMEVAARRAQRNGVGRTMSFRQRPSSLARVSLSPDVRL